jgi:hypothetical protein
MPLIILIKLIIIFFQLTTLAFDQWWFCDDFGTPTNEFFCDQCLVGFFKRFHQGFFPFNLCKKLHFFVASHIKSTYSYWYYANL